METVSRTVSVNQYVSLLCLYRWVLEDDPDIASLIGEYLGLHLQDDSWSLSDRVRITYEARQLLLNCNSPGEPTGLCYTCLIVTSGPHCCLPNISEEGKWLCDETFQWRGATVSHKKGAFVGSLMEPWRALRAKNSTSSGTSL
eukprot:s3608_g1.t1